LQIGSRRHVAVHFTFDARAPGFIPFGRKLDERNQEILRKSVGGEEDGFAHRRGVE
jgi:hypothetical protein